MITIEAEIRGNTPLLVHRFSEEAEAEEATRQVKVAAVDPRSAAQASAYIADDGTYYFSAFAIPAAMGTAGANHKMRGSRKTLRFVVPSAVRMQSDTITILNGSAPAKNFEVDGRPVTIPATKGRVMRYRPRFNQWGAKFSFVLNNALLAEKDAQRLLTEAGDSVGIGDFRPEKRGPFGTFAVVRWSSTADSD